MVEAQNKIVSIETFRAARTADRPAGVIHRGTARVRPHLSPRSVEHRERMLQFLRMVSLQRKEVQGRLLL